MLNSPLSISERFARGAYMDNLVFSQEEERYLASLEKQVETQFSDNPSRPLIIFYIQELRMVRKQFGKEAVICRELCDVIGDSYEWIWKNLASHPNSEPLQRAKMHRSAQKWYAAVERKY